jgi:hypothetical protein
VERDIKGSPNRQEFLERALDWVSQGEIGSYMSQHRNDTNINELKTYFNSVIDWASGVFVDVLPEMRGLQWGRLYKTYRGKPYDPKQMSAEVKKLAADPYVTSRKGIFEYLLGGGVDTKLLEVRVFDTQVKRVVYSKQTQAAEGKGKSNCPHCAMGHDSNKAESTSWMRWTPTTLRHGAMAAEAQRRTARCCASLTTVPREIAELARS